MMSLFLPGNIFTRVLSSCFPEDIKSKVKFLSSAQITMAIENDNMAAGLIPVMDLLKHKDLFVSGKYGISFEGSLCNSYIYYMSGGTQDSTIKNFSNKISLAGDVSSQEVILSKILFKELYGSDIEIEIVTSIEKSDDKNLLIIGDENFKEDRFRKGVSFSDIIIDTISLPFVNYVFASVNKSALENYEKNFEGIQTLFYNKIEKEDFDKNISLPSKDYIRSNISSFIFKFDVQDREGIEQILRLPYFYGIVKDINEVKFV